MEQAKSFFLQIWSALTSHSELRRATLLNVWKWWNVYISAKSSYHFAADSKIEEFKSSMKCHLFVDVVF
jgi:hypothetical protein